MTPILDINILDTHSLSSIAVVDVSSYPPDWTNTNPSIQITPPGFTPITLAFTPSSIQIYKSSTLGIVCDWCDELELPDGLWKFKYSIYPSNSLYIEKTFPRVDRLQSKFDEAYISLDITECNERIKKEDKLFLSNIEDYIAGAIAAGNRCVEKAFLTYYSKATEMLNQFINRKSCAIQ